MSGISRRAFGVSILSLCSASCDNTRDALEMEAGAIAEREATSFHWHLDGGNFAAVYHDADADLKKGVTLREFVTLLTAIHYQLGTVVSSSKKSSEVSLGKAVTTVYLSYETQFVHGKGTESFCYRVVKGRAILVGYHINSSTLISN